MPEITKSESVVATEGSTVQILCRAQGLPTPQISINYLGEKVDEQRYEMKTNVGFLSIYSLRPLLSLRSLNDIMVTT